MDTATTFKASETPVTAQCRRIRQSWTESEKTVRALRANLAQSRLAVAILFRDMSAGCVK